MSIFARIATAARELQGTRRCPTKAALLAYMRQKQGKRPEAYEFLQYWVSMRCWYTSDSRPDDNWKPIEQILAKDATGEMGDDCEGMSTIKKTVINDLGWGHAEHLVVWADHDTMRGGLPWCHAVCITQDKGPGVLLQDYFMGRYATVREAVAAVGRYHKVRPTRYAYYSDQGQRVGDEVRL